MRNSVFAIGCSLLTLILTSGPVAAHDPSAWGGIYRSRDGGTTWLPANEGRFVTAALGLAISPTDPAHLLLATDSGLLRSRNGGRDWELDGRGVLLGGVFAVAFEADGQGSLASTGAAIFRTDDGATWERTAAPAGAAPARAIVPGAVTGQVYLAGWRGLFRSDDWGATWVPVGDGLPDGPLGALIAPSGPRAALLAVVAGEVWATFDGGLAWQPRDNGLPRGRVDSLALDPRGADRLWAAGLDRLFRSDDLGASWRPEGNPLDNRDTAIRGIGVALSGSQIILTTDRGLYGSPDGGGTWDLLIDNLPVHLEARPLVRDPHDPASLYAGFSITPYDSLWRTAAEGSSALARLDPLSLAGGVAFLLLLALGAGATLRWFGRYYRPAPRAETPPVSARRNLALGRSRR